MPEIVCPPDFNDRLDRALPRLVDGLSRTQARKLIAAGSVFVDGRRCRVASRPVRAGNRLRLESPPPAPAPAAALTVLHVDADCIAIDKPAGMPSAPTRQAAAGTALAELQAQLRAAGGGDLWLVHRLDAATSGVLLLARTREAAQRLDAHFRERTAVKDYVAWVAGGLAGERGCIDAPLKRSGKRSIVDPGGQAASTAWEVIEHRGDRTLLRLRPATGRMHQLRAHLQSIGHPVVGDRLYGGPPAPRLLLHALRLRLPRGGGQPELEIEAPLPAEFA